MKAINVEVKYGLAYIDDKCCSFETVEIREDIEKIVEKGKDFILPNKYSYVVTKSKSFAKIINNPSTHHEAKADKTMNKEEKKAIHYLSNWGYGKGSNFNTGNVCGLMERYAELKTKELREENERLNTALENQKNQTVSNRELWEQSELKLQTANEENARLREEIQREIDNSLIECDYIKADSLRRIIEQG